MTMSVFAPSPYLQPHTLHSILNYMIVWVALVSQSSKPWSLNLPKPVVALQGIQCPFVNPIVCTSLNRFLVLN